MNKIKLTAIIICVIMVCSLFITVYADSGKGTIVDNTSTLSESTINAVEKQINEAYQKHGYAIAVIFESKLSNNSREEISEQYYEKCGFSKKGGILLYVGVDSRVYNIWRIIGDNTTKIDEDELDYIAYSVEMALEDNRFNDAVLRFAQLSLEAMERGSDMTYVLGTKTAGDIAVTIVISLIIGLVISLIIMFSIKSSMKTVRPQKSASGYAVSASFKLKNSQDRFLYSRITRTVKPQNNSSSGGSRSSGGSHRGGRF